MLPLPEPSTDGCFRGKGGDRLGVSVQADRSLSRRPSAAGFNPPG